MKTRLITVLCIMAFQFANASDTISLAKNNERIRISLNGKIGLMGKVGPQENLVFTFEQLKNNNHLVGIRNNVKYKITQFFCSFGYSSINKRLTESPVFYGDSFSNEYLEYLGSLRDGISINLHSVHFLSPDSVEIIYDNLELGSLVRDSSSLLIRKYGGSWRALSDIRLKIIGKPSSKDLETIENIIYEANASSPGIKIKRVNFLPTVVISFDTISPVLHSYVFSRIKSNINPLFPKLESSYLGLNSKIYNQQARDSILWEHMLYTLFVPWTEEMQHPLFNGGKPQNGFSNEGKLAIKTILSAKNHSKIKEIWETTNLPSVNLLFTILISIIIYLILREIISYYGLIQASKYKLVIRAFLALLFVQIIIALMYFIEKDWFEKFSVVQYEVYFSSFAFSVTILIWLSQKLTNHISTKWIRLACNPIASIVILYLAYQIVYLFVRCELLRWQLIEVKAFTVAIAFVTVRFFNEYQSQKLLSLMQEKEYELTKHKELQNRAELDALQARINPHFLYNALNSIAELVHVDSKRTECMVLSLSKLFQYNVNREGQALTTVSQEIEMVQVYLEIEKQRFGDRLSFSVDVASSALNYQIPRFLIQPLIENAIKHGISGNVKNGVIILKVYKKNEKLAIEVYDNGPAFPEGINSGYGLQNIYEKLNIIHKKPYEVKFINTPEKYLQIIL